MRLELPTPARRPATPPPAHRAAPAGRRTGGSGRSPRRLVTLVALAVLLVAGTAGASLVAVPEDDAPVPTSVLRERVRADGERFLDTYVTAEGRVARHDEGGDTSSEGQAYALLVAAALGDRERFDLVWDWTVANLRRPDGLLASRWASGSVVEAESAAAANLDAAWALAVAARRWPDATYRDQASAMAAAVGLHETMTLEDGTKLLVAGPWAKGDPATGTPSVVNPGHASPVAEAVLAADGRAPADVAEARAASARTVIAELLDAHATPSDWAHVAGDGTTVPADPPAAVGDPELGWDAVRMPLRHAASCDDDDRELAARRWPAIEEAADADALGDHPAELVGAAAAAGAAGEHERSLELLDRASARAHTTFFGSASTALGRLLLTTHLLGGCPITA